MILININLFPFSEEDQQSNFEQCGYLFQWGRKTPFEFPGCDVVVKNSISFATIQEYPTFEEGISPAYEYLDKFIAREGTALCWFRDEGLDSALSPILTADPTWPRQTDPCPVGWHVPLEEEAQSLVNLFKEEKASSDWMVHSSIKPTLNFPNTGEIDINYAVGRYVAGFRYLVSRYQSSVQIYTFSFAASSSGVKVDVGTFNTYGLQAYPVRCVQDPIP